MSVVKFFNIVNSKVVNFVNYDCKISSGFKMPIVEVICLCRSGILFDVNMSNISFNIILDVNSLCTWLPLNV